MSQSLSHSETDSYVANNRKLHKFATTNSNFEKIDYLVMHPRITYMYINFQQTQVSRSVQTVHTNIFANNCKLHKFATTNSNFVKIHYLDMHHLIAFMYINFQQTRVSRLVKIRTYTFFGKKNRKLHKFEIAILKKVWANL